MYFNSWVSVWFCSCATRDVSWRVYALNGCIYEEKWQQDFVNIHHGDQKLTVTFFLFRNTLALRYPVPQWSDYKKVGNGSGAV